MPMVVYMDVFLRRLLGLSFKLLLVSRVLEPRSASLGLLFRIAMVVIYAAAPSLLGAIMPLRQGFGVFEGLDCGMVVILMFIFMNEGLLASFVLLFNVSVFDSWRNLRLKSCIFVALGVRSAVAVCIAINACIAVGILTAVGICIPVGGSVGRGIVRDISVTPSRRLVRSGKEPAYCINGVIHNANLSVE